MFTLNQLQRLNAPKTNEDISIPEGNILINGHRIMVYPSYNGPKQGWLEHYERVLSSWTAHERNEVYWAIIDYIC